MILRHSKEQGTSSLETYREALEPNVSVSCCELQAESGASFPPFATIGEAALLLLWQMPVESNTNDLPLGHSRVCSGSRNRPRIFVSCTHFATIQPISVLKMEPKVKSYTRWF